MVFDIDRDRYRSPLAGPMVAPVALFWPAFIVLFAQAIAHCMNAHPVDPGMWCLP
jgi:hypothetical protein